MVYLFEDRTDRMMACLKEPLDELRIKHVSNFSSSKQEMEECIDKNYGDASLVLLHGSFGFTDKNMNPLIMQHAFNVRNVPVVIFSGGNNGSNVSSFRNVNNGVMNSKVMYEHLPDFLKQKDDGNVARLIYGDKYVLNILLKFQKRVYECLFEYADDTIISKRTLYDIQDSLTILKGAELDCAKTKIKNSSFKESITAHSVKNCIQNIIEEY